MSKKFQNVLKEVEQANEVKPTVEVSPGRRVTRSTTQAQLRLTRSTSRSRDSPGASSGGSPLKKLKTNSGKAQPTKKKPNNEPTNSKAIIKQEQETDDDHDDDDDDDHDEGDDEDEELAGMKDLKVTDGSGSGSKSHTVVIEHCQGNIFKTKAGQVKEGLEKALAGITVLINPKKARKGFFEVREEDGQTFISLPDMKKPFQQLKDLDVEQVISDIVAKLQA